jgi:FixJ family two-component response regulator
MLKDKHLIVVVEDDAGMKQAMERLLKAGGFRATAFSSAESLLDAGLPAGAACYILDLHLPGLPGFELATQLRARGCRVPVIFITAHDDLKSRKRAKADWVIERFIKPFAGSALLGAVAKAIELEFPEFATEPSNHKGLL